MAPTVILGGTPATQALDIRPEPISLWHDLALKNPAGHASHLAHDDFGNVWYQDTSTDHLVRIDTTTLVQTDFDLTGTVWMSAIVVDPGGTVWFADAFNNAVGSFDPSTGTVQSFPLTGASFASTSLVIGADGNVWFGDQARAQLGRLTPAGGLSFISEPTGHVVLSMTAAPDGRLWYTRDGSDSVGSFDPLTGRFYDAGVGSDVGDKLTVSATGDIWVAGVSKFTRISPVGTVTVYPIVAPGPASVVPVALVGCKDVDVCFLDQKYGFGTITVGGAVNFSRLDGNRTAIELDSNGRVWVNIAWGHTLSWE